MRLFPAFKSEPEVRQWNDTGNGPWFSPGDPAAYVDECRALNLSAVWACETLIADAISTLPVDQYRKEKKLRVEVPTARWIDTPNVLNNRIDFDTQRIFSLLGWGNAYTMLVRQYGTSDSLDPIVERWNLAPGDVNVDCSGSHPVFTYREEVLPAGNVQHIPGYKLPGMLLGMSAIAHAQTTLSAAVNADSASSSIFENGIAPSGVLEVPDMPVETSKEVVEKIRDQFGRAHGGPANTGRPMVLPGGTTWKQTMLTPADAQLLESRRFSINEICRWFRVPPHEIQDIIDNASQGGGQGIEQMSINFAQKTLLPWVSRLEAADSALIARGQYVKYNLNAYVRTDLKTRYEAHSIARLGGWASVNEIRKLEDEQPIGDAGDIYLQPMNYQEAGTEPAPAPAPDPADDGESDGSE